jgi:hypothetical protein
MLAQGAFIILLIIYSRARRFARPLPLSRERRTTTLEFVGSMATIARLARASDLAMQNIYSEFRRRLCRFSNLSSSVETAKLARAVAVRAGLDERDLKLLLLKCEQVAHGEHVSDSEMLQLVSRVRSVEELIH